MAIGQFLTSSKRGLTQEKPVGALAFGASVSELAVPADGGWGLIHDHRRGTRKGTVIKQRHAGWPS